MHGSKLSKIGRKSVPEFRSRQVYCGFPGVCSYLLDVICILVFLVYDCVFKVFEFLFSIPTFRAILFDKFSM